jgi:hypothetical protein
VECSGNCAQCLLLARVDYAWLQLVLLGGVCYAAGDSNVPEGDVGGVLSSALVASDFSLAVQGAVKGDPGWWLLPLLGSAVAQ